jgi:hypothetical protein
MTILAGVRTELAGLAAGFDAGALTATEAAAVVSEATAVINLVSSVRMLAATRVAQSGAWRHRGYRTAAEWLASVTKCSVAEAIAVLETAENLPDCPGVEAKVRAGELTGPQAHAISKAVVADPASESKLLETAQTDGLSKLKQSCRSVEDAASGADAEARYARIRRNRSLRHWSDPDGTFRLDGRLTPDAGAKLLGALAPFEKQAFRQARHDDRHETPDAYRADALEALADASLAGTTSDHDRDPDHDTDDDECDDHDGCADDGDAGGDDGDAGKSKDTKTKRPRSRKPSFTVLVDLQALLRGHTQAGETCEIPGVGPVPVSLLYDYAPQAVWHALITDGVDIRAYCSLTRHIPTMLRVALEARDRECIVPGCNTRTGLQIDHLVPVEDGGPTSYANTGRLCHHDHHTNKHRKGWTLTGGPGHWTFTPPNQASPQPSDDPDPP